MARALFIGTRTPLSAGILGGWLASGNEVAAVWSERNVAPTPLTRWLAPKWSIDRQIAEHRLPVRTVPRLSRWDGLMDEVRAVGADVLITGATSLIVPAHMLAHFGGRAANIHPTLLPAYRGPTPYLAMLRDAAGDTFGGVTLHVLSPGIDEGDVIASERVGYGDSGGHFADWYGALIASAYRLTRDKLPAYLAGAIAAVPQPPGGTYERVATPLVMPTDLSRADVAELLRRAGSTHKLAVQLEGRQRPVRVTEIVGTTERTGRPARLSLRAVELEFADARLRLRRSSRLARFRDERRTQRAIDAQL